MRLNPSTILPWLLLLAIAIFTLSPIQLRPHTGTPPQFERLAAFALLGLSFAWAYPRRWLYSFLGLALIALILEAGQLLSLDRHWGLRDLVAKIAGAALGILLAKAWQTLWRRLAQ